MGKKNKKNTTESTPQDFRDKYVSWDGKDFNDYISSDHDHFEDEAGRKLTGDDYYRARQTARSFLNPLRRAGMGENDMQYYAKKAGIRNVSTKGDLDQIISKYEADRTPRTVNVPASEPTPTTTPAEKPKGDLVIESPSQRIESPSSSTESPSSRPEMGESSFSQKYLEDGNFTLPNIFGGSHTADAPDNKAGNIFDESTTANTPTKDPQAFADQYKLNLINSGVTKKPNDQDKPELMPS